MRLNVYDAHVDENDFRTILVKEKGINYGVELYDKPEYIATMMNQVFDLGRKGEEYCYMLALNTKCKIIGVFMISKGTAKSSLVGAREVFLRAILLGATGIILIHNHPSKSIVPSREDINVTKRIKEAGILLGVELLDHIIIGGDQFISFREAKIM